MKTTPTISRKGSPRIDFEEQYLKLRQKEGRLYPDEIVQSLPYVARNDAYYKEWKLRRRSSDRLLKFLNAKKRALKILEVGCGNGWLSHRLSGIRQSEVTGMDINLLELHQAERVFGRQRNLHFIYGNFCREFLERERFDVIIFSASIQYFKNFRETVCIALDHLHEGGEMHINDTNFYPAAELERARRRSVEYFARMGMEHMQEFYYHHSLEALDRFRYRLLYDPSSFIHRLMRSGPFPWIIIKPSA